MAASPVWKVYDAAGKYQAACAEPEGAACLVGGLYPGGTVRYNHKLIVWREPADPTNPEDGPSAGESWDLAAIAMVKAVKPEQIRH